MDSIIAPMFTIAIMRVHTTNNPNFDADGTSSIPLVEYVHVCMPNDNLMRMKKFSVQVLHFIMIYSVLYVKVDLENHFQITRLIKKRR